MLARIRKSMEEKDQGFTLIELLVVMIIIGVLASIAIPVFLNQRKKAVDSAMKSDLRTVANSMETYFVDQQSYPVIGTSFTASAAATPTVVIGTTNVSVTKGNVITDEATGAAAGTYCLKVTNTNGSGDLYYDSDKGGLLPSGTTCS